MTIEHFETLFPYIIMTLYVFASCVYFWSGDYRRGFYWLFALGLTICITE